MLGFETPLWKEKYKISWCHLCDAAILTCPACENTTCNAGGCDACHETFIEFNKGKVTVFAYLTDDESAVYQKAMRIQNFILESLAKGRSEINWKQLDEDGEMTDHDVKVFEKELA